MNNAPSTVRLVIGGFVGLIIIGFGILAYQNYTQARVAFTTGQTASYTLDAKDSVSTVDFTATVSPGAHTITVTKTGFRPYKATFEVPVHGTISKTISLEPLALKDQFVAAANADGIKSLGTATPGFTVLDSETFLNGEWIAAKIVSTTVNTDPAVIVFRRIDGSLKVILGPGTKFDQSAVDDGIPQEVIQYLLQQGFMDEKIPS